MTEKRGASDAGVRRRTPTSSAAAAEPEPHKSGRKPRAARDGGAEAVAPRPRRRAAPAASTTLSEATGGAQQAPTRSGGHPAEAPLPALIIQNRLDDRVPVFELFQYLGIRRVAAFRLLDRRQLQLFKEDFAQLLG